MYNQSSYWLLFLKKRESIKRCSQSTILGLTKYENLPISVNTMTKKEQNIDSVAVKTDTVLENIPVKMELWLL